MLEKVTTRRPRGVTLVELLVGVVILAILTALAVPSFLSLMEDRRLVGAAENLLATVKLAQSEAARTNLDVTMTFVAGNTPEDWSYEVASESPRQASGSEYGGTTLTLLTDSDSLTVESKRGGIKSGVSSVALTEQVAFLNFSVTSGKSVTLLVGPGAAVGLCSSTVKGYPACQ